MVVTGTIGWFVVGSFYGFVAGVGLGAALIMIAVVLAVRHERRKQAAQVRPSRLVRVVVVVIIGGAMLVAWKWIDERREARAALAAAGLAPIPAAATDSDSKVEHGFPDRTAIFTFRATTPVIQAWERASPGLQTAVLSRWPRKLWDDNQQTFEVRGPTGVNASVNFDRSIGTVAVFVDLDELSPPPPPCTLTSPWLQYQAEPPAAAAVGDLTYFMDGPLNVPSRRDIEIRWMNGQRTTYVRDKFLSNPEGDTVPILGDPHTPAVFAVQGDDALVRGDLGWACAPTKLAGQNMFRSFDEYLAQVIATMNGEAEHPDGDRHVLYRNVVLTVQPQPLRVEPREDARPSGIETTATMPCLRSTDRFGFGTSSVPDSATIKRLKWSQAGCYQPVRVVERKGHWARLVLPSTDGPMYDLDPGLLVAWNEQPSGWAKIEDDGPVPGSRMIKWSIKNWWVP